MESQHPRGYTRIVNGTRRWRCLIKTGNLAALEFGRAFSSHPIEKSFTRARGRHCETFVLRLTIALYLNIGKIIHSTVRIGREIHSSICLKRYIGLNTVVQRIFDGQYWRLTHRQLFFLNILEIHYILGPQPMGCLSYPKTKIIIIHPLAYKFNFGNL